MRYAKRVRRDFPSTEYEGKVETRNDDGEGCGIFTLLIIFLIFIFGMSTCDGWEKMTGSKAEMIKRCATDKEPPPYCAELAKGLSK